jgi:hypothetical protein
MRHFLHLRLPLHGNILLIINALLTPVAPLSTFVAGFELGHALYCLSMLLILCNVHVLERLGTGFAYSYRRSN